MMDRRASIDRFYKLLDLNIARCGRYQFGALSTLGSLYSNPELNHAGVYFMFEPDEYREDGVSQRVIYVGRTKKQNPLFVRLEQHSRDSNKSNFNGYIFEALARAAGKGNEFSPFFKEYWRDIPDVPYEEMRAFEFEMVLPSIRKMSFTWLPVLQPDKRQRLEQGTIALLSNCARADVGAPTDPSSVTWPGRSMRSKPHIFESGLWNNNEDVKRDLGNCAWLDEFEQLVAPL